MGKCRFADKCLGYKKDNFCCNDEWEASHTCGKYNKYMEKSAEMRAKESDKGFFGFGILGRFRRKEGVP